jgi:hypothetical protein
MSSPEGDMAITIKTRRIAAGSYEVDTPSGTYRLEDCPTDRSNPHLAGLPSGPRWMLTWPGEYHADAEFPTKRAAIKSIHANEQWTADQAAKTTQEPPMPATTDFTPGQRITVANGTTQTVVKMADRIGNEPQRVEVEGGLQWIAADCEPAPEGTTYCGTCGEVYPTTAALDAHQNATNHERFEVHQTGHNRFAVRDTRTGIDASVSTSRSGAKHIADCLTDGTMVLDQDGRAIAVAPPTIAAVTDSGTFGVFDQDGECVDGPYYHRGEAEQQARAHQDDDEDGEYIVREMCPDHDGSANDHCADCYKDEN